MGQTLERAMVGIMVVTPFLGDGKSMIETRGRCEMLGLLEGVSGSSPEDQDELNCEFCCEKKAEIFQIIGNYCLHCWQQETHPDV
jgi:hypothetical protein